LGDLKTENELVMSSEDEKGVVLKRGLVVETNFRKDKDGIECDVKRMIDNGKEMEMMKVANQGKGLEVGIVMKFEKEAEMVVEPEMDEEKV